MGLVVRFSAGVVAHDVGKGLQAVLVSGIIPGAPVKTPTMRARASGCSSVDRVLASEAKGRGFDPRQPRQRITVLSRAR